jgi:tetratricopeptide (TPR) repeat protein
MNKENKAAADYTKAIEFNPYNAHYWHRRGGSYLQLGEPSKAVADYTKAIELAPTKAHYWYMRGVCYLQLGEPSKAVADYTKAIELDPNDAYLHYRRALAHLDMGDTEGYRDRCAQMLDHFGQTQEAVAAHWVAWTCALTANAVEDFNRLVELAEFAIEEGEKTVQNLTSLGAILYRSGRLDEAVQKLRDLATEWEQGTELPTETSPAYTWFFLAMAHHILGHADESQRYFELAVKRANQEMTGTAGWNRKLTLQLLQAEARSLLGVSERSSLSQKEVGSEKRN